MTQQQDRASNAPETQRNPDYPVSEHFKVLEGYDIYRSNRLILALVVVDGIFECTDGSSEMTPGKLIYVG